MASSSSYPTVSVVIPCYNPGFLLYRALRSVVRQTYPALEIIVVDDCSTDRSVELMKSYFPGVTFVQNAKNLGVSATRNHGAELASGEFLAFLDADDEWYRKKLENQVARMISSSAEVSFTGFRDMRLSVRHWGRRPLSGKLSEVLVSGIPFNASTLMVLRTVFKSIGGFDANLRRAEDLDLFYRLSQSGVRGLFLPDALATYHHDNEASITRSNCVSSSFAALIHRLKHLAKDEKSSDHLRTIQSATRHFTGRYLSDCTRGNEDPRLFNDLIHYGEGAHKMVALIVTKLPRPFRGKVALLVLQVYRFKQQRSFRAS